MNIEQLDEPIIVKDTKKVTQELLRHGILESSNKTHLYQYCVLNRQEINRILSPLDVQLEIDDVRGLAFLKVLKDDEELVDDEWKHPLIHKQRMNLEQSLMVAICRQHFVAHELESGVGFQKAQVHLDDLLPELNQFLGASGSDERDERRLRQLLDQLKTYSLVSAVDDNDRVTIRPLIAHVANPDNLKGLIMALQQHLALEQP